MRKHKGFTLLEILIVVAIIAVLAAVSIPVFQAQLEKTREATCAANRRSLKAVLSIEYLSNGEGGIEDLYKSKISEFSCPDGGDITYELTAYGNIVVHCSKHVPAMIKSSEALKDALSSVGVDLKAGNRIDSSAALTSGTKAESIQAALEEAGAEDIAAWAIVNSSAQGMQYIWTTYDIKNMKQSSGVPAICYSEKTGEYIVGSSSIRKSGAQNHIAPSSENIGFNPRLAKTFKYYEDAVEYYKTLSPVDNNR